MTGPAVVLVHGAWHGGWCWDRVRPLLTRHGVDVHAPTLTGLGERAHLLAPAVGLRTHVDDVVDHLARRDLRDAVLVGHSYAGLVVREAADRVPERVARVVLLDAWVGADGHSLADLAPSWFVDALRRSVEEAGDGWLCPPPPPDLVGVTEPDDRAWLDGRLGPQPWRTFTDPTHLRGRVDDIEHHAVVCRSDLGLPFTAMAEAVGARPTAVLDTGHDAMVTCPDQVAAAIARAAGVPATSSGAGRT